MRWGKSVLVTRGQRNRDVRGATLSIQQGMMRFCWVLVIASRSGTALKGSDPVLPKWGYKGAIPRGRATVRGW